MIMVFLNLNTVDDKIITLIYNIVLNTINYKEKIYNIDEKEETVLEDIITENIKENKSKINENFLTYKHFSKKEQKIIDYSKKYNL